MTDAVTRRKRNGNIYGIKTEIDVSTVVSPALPFSWENRIPVVSTFPSIDQWTVSQKFVKQ